MKAEEILKLDIKKELVNLLDEKFIFERKAFPYMVNDREIYMKGIDHSYYYEGYVIYKTEDL